MPKLGKRQKNSKGVPDFEKKKRKVGKGKQPAENVTPLNFKSGSIVVPAQLGETSNQKPTTYRKLGFKALMTQVKHYKAAVRLSALAGLREFFQANPDLLIIHLAKLLEQVMDRVVDESTHVRRALCTLLTVVLEKLSPEQLMPFSSLIVAHLSCGLTHIDDAIQLDSLKVLAVFLNQPSVLVPYAFSVLPLLIKLISRQHHASTSKAKNNILLTVRNARAQLGIQSQASLASNPDSKLASQTSRLQIFLQLSKFIEAVFESYVKKSELESLTESNLHAPVVDTVHHCVYLQNEDSHLYKTDDTTLVNFSSSIPHVPILRNSGIFIPDVCKTAQDPDILTPANKKACLDLVQSLLSLLVESWIEFSPEANLSKVPQKCTLLSLMEVILQLILIVLKLVHFLDQSLAHSWSSTNSLTVIIFDKFWGDFQTHFLSHLPQPSFKEHDSQTTVLTFMVCQITVKLLEIPNTKISSRELMDALTAITSHLASLSSDTIVNRSLSTTDSFQRCVQIIVQIFPALLRLFGSLKDQSSDALCKMAIKGVWSVYSVCHPLSKNKQLFIECFGRLLKSELDFKQSSQRSNIMSDLLLPWLQTLPEILLAQTEDSGQTVLSLTVDSMVTSAVHGSKELDGVIAALTTMLFSPNGTLAKLSSPTQRKCVDMLWHLPPQTFFQRGILGLVTQTIQTGVLDLAVTVYLVQTVHHKFIRQFTAHEQTQFVGPYLCFMISIVVGCSLESLQEMANFPHHTRLLPPAFSIVQTSLQVDCFHQARVVKVVCDCLYASSISHQVLHTLEQAFDLPMANPSLPLDTIVSLLTLGKRLIPITSPALSDNQSLLFARLCLALLFTMETTSDLASEQLIIKYQKLAHEILCCSESVLESLLWEIPQQFSKEQEMCNSSNVTAILKVAVTLLGSTRANRSLKTTRVVHSTLTKILELVRNIEKMETKGNHFVKQLKTMHEKLDGQNLRIIQNTS